MNKSKSMRNILVCTCMMLLLCAMPQTLNAQRRETTNVNYKEQYEKWESVAKRNYNSLTNSGNKTKNDGKNKKGDNKQGQDGKNNASQKKELLEAQSQMKSIRQKASKAGVSISKSKYETVSVSH